MKKVNTQQPLRTSRRKCRRADERQDLPAETPDGSPCASSTPQASISLLSDQHKTPWHQWNRVFGSLLCRTSLNPRTTSHQRRFVPDSEISQHGGIRIDVSEWLFSSCSAELISGLTVRPPSYRSGHRDCRDRSSITAYSGEMAPMTISRLKRCGERAGRLEIRVRASQIQCRLWRFPSRYLCHPAASRPRLPAYAADHYYVFRDYLLGSSRSRQMHALGPWPPLSSVAQADGDQHQNRRCLRTISVSQALLWRFPRSLQY